jgi:hypothetical protein
MYNNSMKTNLDNNKYVRHTRRLGDNQRQGYETCPVVLLLFCYVGESLLEILLVLFSCARLELELVFVMGLWAGICHKPLSWCLFWVD